MTVIDYGALKYEAKDIEYNYFTRICNYFSGLSKRNSTFRSFCASNGIDFPINWEVKYKMPKEYVVDNPRIETIGLIRDKIICNFYDEYAARESLLNSHISEVEKRIRSQKDYIEQEERKLDDVRRKLHKEKDPAEYISLQSRESQLVTKIANQNAILDTQLDEHVLLLGIGEQNLNNWARQKKIILVATKKLIASLVNNTGKKITRKFGFDDFEYIEPDYTDKVKKIMGDK